MLIFYIIIFLASCFLLFWAGSWLVEALARICKFLHWREFVVAFFVMAFACSLPNLFVGINSAINKVPQLSFGDIVGGNVINLTLVVALAVLFSRGSLPAESRMVQSSNLFAVFAAVLPLLLILDGNLSRLDGVFLICAFIVYAVWLFSKEDRFKKVYEDGPKPIGGFLSFLKDAAKVIFALVILLAASIGIVKSSITRFFASFSASAIVCGLLNLDGIVIPTTFSAPKAATAIAATTEESTPPLRPTMVFLKSFFPT
jgi:cation:H+ antiporter